MLVFLEQESESGGEDGEGEGGTGKCSGREEKKATIRYY